MAILGTKPPANGSSWSTATDGWSRQTSLASQGSVVGAPFSGLSEDADSGLEDNDLSSKAIYRGSNKIRSNTRREADWRPMFGKTCSSKSDTAALDRCNYWCKDIATIIDSAPRDHRDVLHGQGPAGGRSKRNGPSGSSDDDWRPVFTRTSSSKSDNATLKRLPGVASSGDDVFGKSFSGDAMFGKTSSGSYADTIRARGEAIRQCLYSDYLASTFRSPTEDKPQKQKSHKSPDVPLAQPEPCLGCLGSIHSSQQQYLTASAGHVGEIDRVACLAIQQLNMLSPYQSQSEPGPLQQQGAMTSPRLFPMRGFRPPPGLECQF